MPHRSPLSYIKCELPQFSCNSLAFSFSRIRPRSSSLMASPANFHNPNIDDLEGQKPTISKSFTIDSDMTYIPPIPVLSQMHFAFQSMNKTAILLTAQVPKDASDIQVVHRLRETLSSFLENHRYELWPTRAIVRSVVGIARIENVRRPQRRGIHRCPDLRGLCDQIVLLPTSRPPCPYPHVYLRDFKSDQLLTDAFQNSSLPHPRFAASYEATTSSEKKLLSQLCHDGGSVLVVRRELDRAKVAWLLIFLLVLSPSLGVVVGWLSHRADVGVAASAAIFALASFLQGLVVWIQG